MLGKTVKEMDLTEKMAFFEAYGSIAGAGGLKALSGMLLPRGLLKLKESSGDPGLRRDRHRQDPHAGGARGADQRAAEDKDLVVRNAVSRALRESAT